MGNRGSGARPAPAPQMAQLSLSGEQLDKLGQMLYAKASPHKSSRRLSFSSAKAVVFCDRGVFVARINEYAAEDSSLPAGALAIAYDVLGRGEDRMEVRAILAALACFVRASPAERARRTFAALDRHSTGGLAKGDVLAHAGRLLRFSAWLAAENVRHSFAETHNEAVAAGMALEAETRMDKVQKRFANDVVREVFRFDSDNDGVLSDVEWQEAAEQCATLQVLLEASRCTDIWLRLFAPSAAGSGDALLTDALNSPEGLVKIINTLTPGALPGERAPPTSSLTLACSGVWVDEADGAEGGVYEESHEFAAGSDFDDLLCFLSTLSSVPRPNMLVHRNDVIVYTLDESQLLVELGFVNGDAVCVTDDREPWNGVVHVRTIARDVCDVAADSAMTVAAVKRTVANGAAPETIQLILHGKPLEDDATLGSCKVVSGTTLHCVRRAALSRRASRAASDTLQLLGFDD